MAAELPNILFLLSDEHSYRYFSYLGEPEGEPVRTPRLDSLATGGTNFRQAYCQMPLCTPSRMCMLTGRDQQRCGAWDNGSWLDPSMPTLPGVFADSGYETCLVGKMHFGGDRQYNGFKHRPYGDLTGHAGHQTEPIVREQGHPNGMRGRTANAGITGIPESRLQEQIIVRESMAWLREHTHASPGQPWFLCASFSRPHFPLTAPRRFFERYWPDGVTPPKMGPGSTHEHPMTLGMRAGFRTDEIEHEEAMRARAAYFACVDYLDEILDDFFVMLEHAGMLENTIIVYTTDHGELAGEHGLWWKNSWHEGAARAPFFVQTPDQRSGAAPPHTIDTPVSLVDLFPTLCGLTGLTAPNDIDGADLSDAVRTGTEPARGPVVCDALSPRWGEGTEFRMVRDGNWKYVGFRDAPPILIDLENDPHEQTNRAGDPQSRDVERRLAEHVNGTVDFDAVEKQRIADEERAQRHALKIPRGTRNMYLFPDGRLVDADAEIYHPPVLTGDPAAAFADYPGKR